MRAARLRLGYRFVLFATVTAMEAGRPAGVIYGFHGLFVADLMAHVLKLAAYGAVALALVYSRQYLLDRGLLRGEFLTLLLFALLGMMVMMSANSFLTVYLGLELMSLCLYSLVALNRDSAASTEAAMKYFVLGALASGLLLYGMSMIYGATGTLDIAGVAKQVALASKDVTQQAVLVFGLVFVVSGIAFKLGVVPFHMWIPDVYHGAPTAVTLVIGTAPKLAAFAMAMRLLVNGLLDLAHDWQQMLVILAVLSMAIGNIAAIAQTNLKRMLAYSTIAHMGFMLLGLLSGVVGGNCAERRTTPTRGDVLRLVYVLMTLGSFGMVLLPVARGLRGREPRRLQGPEPAQPLVRLRDAAADVLARRGAADGGLLRQAGGAPAAVQRGPDRGWRWWRWCSRWSAPSTTCAIVKLMYFDEPKDATPAAGQAIGMQILLSANGLALLALGMLPRMADEHLLPRHQEPVRLEPEGPRASSSSAGEAGLPTAIAAQGAPRRGAPARRRAGRARVHPASRARC